MDSELDEAGPFIAGSPLVYSHAVGAASPQELIIEPEQEDTKHIAFTRLWARKGEPSDITNRRAAPKSETWQLLTIEPPPIGSATGAYSITVAEMPASDKVTDTPVIVAVTTRGQTKAGGEERDRITKPEEPPNGSSTERDSRQRDKDTDLRLHPNHVMDDDRDEYWNDLIKYLQTWNVPKDIRNKKSFKQKAHKYYIFSNALWRRSAKGPRRVILNRVAREELVRQAHNESGHRGRDPTYRKLADFYFWPNMYAEIALYCQTCRQCQLHSTYWPKVMINLTWVPTVMCKFNMDLVEMGISSNGYEYIVDIRDDLTGWLEAWMLAKKSSEDIAQFLWQDVICRFGCIPQITQGG